MLRALLRNLRRAPEAPRGWVEVERGGVAWRLNLAHYLDREIHAKGAFEVATTRLVHGFVRPGMRIVDVGANFGYYTVLFAQRVGASGHVWAFEPTRSFGDRIGWHLEHNHVNDRVTLLRYGLSDTTAEVEVVLGDSSATLHPTKPELSPGRETIALRRLDDVASELGLDERVDLVKLDIDGHEPAFLRGAETLLRKARPALLIEFSQANLDVAGTDVREQRDLLLALDYVLYSERTGLPFASRREFLEECGNFTHSANVWAFPATQRPERLGAWR